MDIGSKRKSPRALTQISGAISDAKAEYKCKRKELATALKAEIKTEFQGFQNLRSTLTISI